MPRIEDFPEHVRRQIQAQLKPCPPRPSNMHPSRPVVTVRVIPMGKPRMTRRDKWAKRECVLRYRAFADILRAQAGPYMPASPSSLSWTAYLPMPDSWSKKKKDQMRGSPHRQKPDRDNIDKAILDALFEDDSCISDGRLMKRWDDGNGARIEILANE